MPTRAATVLALHQGPGKGSPLGVVHRWHSVQVYPHEDGACDVVCDELERDLGARLDVSASWRVCEGFYVSTASATLLTPPVAKDPRGQGCHGVAVGL